MRPLKGWYWKRKRLRFAVKALLSRTFRTSITHREGLKKLNLGVGDRPLAGWVNYDLKEGPGIDVVGDVRDLSDFDADSFDVVRASHLLEHFYVNEVPALLREWIRVLRPGGFLLICVPDFCGLARDYLDNPAILQPDGWNVPLNPDHLPADYAYLSYIYGWHYENNEMAHMKHHMVFDYQSLVALLTVQGTFTDVREFDYRREEPHLLGVRDASANLWSLNVVATKRTGRNG